jgi:hypothetical protein
MAESITINIVGPEVGIQYHPESCEATFQDEMVAREMGLQVLAAQAIEHRARNGLPVPAVLVAVAEAHTFHDLLRR